MTLRISVEEWRRLWRLEGGVHGRLMYVTKVATKDYPDREVLDTQVVKPNKQQPLYAVHFWLEEGLD